MRVLPVASIPTLGLALPPPSAHLPTMPESRPTHVRSGVRILLFVPAGFMLLFTPGILLTLSGVLGLLTGEGVEALSSLGMGVLILYALFRLVRWAVRPIPVNPDGTIGRYVRVQLPELIRQEAVTPEDLEPAVPAAGRPGPSLVLTPDPGDMPPHVLLKIGTAWILGAGAMVGLALVLALSSGLLTPGFVAAALGMVLVPGVGALLAFGVRTRRSRTWGACRVELPDGPGFPGLPLRMRMVLPHPPRSIREVRVTLMHLTQLPRRGRQGTFSLARGWWETQGEEARRHEAGSAVDLTFHLPPDARPSSRTRGSGASLWQFEVSTHEPPTRKRTLPGQLRFTVPVVAGTPDRATDRTSHSLLPFLFVLGAALVPLASPSPAAAQEASSWKSLEWVVTCHSSVISLLPYENCFHTRNPPFPPLPGRVRWALENASTWLEGLGYRGPNLTEEVGFYLDHTPVDSILPADPRCIPYYCLIMAWIPDFPAEGWYDIGGHVFLTVPLDINRGRTEVHELFHAVQYAYDIKFFDDAFPERYDWGWIMEGSAEYAKLNWERQAAGIDFTPPATSRHLSVRFHDIALHLPPIEWGDPRWNDWAYGSWEFFDFLGQVFPDGDGMGYLRRYLEHHSAPVPGDPTGLVGLDAALRSEGAPGIAYLFTEFVRLRTEPCHFQPFGPFEGWYLPYTCEPESHPDYTFTLTPGDTIRRQHEVEPMAANAYRLQLEVPDGMIGRLEVRVVEGADHPDLRLVVDDRRLDEGPGGAPLPADQRNVFRTVLGAGSDSVFVRLVRAPDDPWEALTDVSAPRMISAEPPHVGRLQFSLVVEEVAVRVAGAVHERLEGGAAMDYHATALDPVEAARAAIPGMVAAQTAHFPDTDEGRAARAEILAAMEEALGTLEPRGQPAGAGGGVCFALLTVYDDERRSLVRLGWQGGASVVDGTLDGVRMQYFHNLSDVVYGPLKDLYHAQRLAEDPVARDAFLGWLTGEAPRAFRAGAYRAAAENQSPDESSRIRALAQRMGGMIQGAGGLAARATPADPEEFGRAWEGQGSLEIADQGDHVVGHFRFEGLPTSPIDREPVSVEGGFTLPVGALLRTLMDQGCEGSEPPPDRRAQRPSAPDPESGEQGPTPPPGPPRPPATGQPTPPSPAGVPRPDRRDAPGERGAPGAGRPDLGEGEAGVGVLPQRTFLVAFPPGGGAAEGTDGNARRLFVEAAAQPLTGVQAGRRFLLDGAGYDLALDSARIPSCLLPGGDPNSTELPRALREGGLVQGFLRLRVDDPAGRGGFEFLAEPRGAGAASPPEGGDPAWGGWVLSVGVETGGANQGRLEVSESGGSFQVLLENAYGTLHLPGVEEVPVCRAGLSFVVTVTPSQERD